MLAEFCYPDFRSTPGFVRGWSFFSYFTRLTSSLLGKGGVLRFGCLYGSFGACEVSIGIFEVLRFKVFEWK